MPQVNISDYWTVYNNVFSDGRPLEDAVAMPSSGLLGAALVMAFALCMPLYLASAVSAGSCCQERRFGAHVRGRRASAGLPPVMPQGHRLQVPHRQPCGLPVSWAGRRERLPLAQQL